MSAQLKPVPAFARESSDTVINEIAPLLEAHWAEIAHYPDIPVNVNYDAYFKFESLNALRIYTVRVGLALVGYAIFQVRPNLHYQSSLQAQQDVLYLCPEHRNGRLGWRFIAWCDAQLQAEGVQVVYQHQKVAHPALGRILHRLGYEAVDTLWAKRLDRGV
jgi:hypothetical protein